METPTLEALFAETEAPGLVRIPNPNPLTREELTEMIRSVLEDPIVNGPTSSVSAATNLDPDAPASSIRDLLRNEIQNILTEGDSPLASTVFRTPRHLSSFVHPVEKEVPKTEYLKTTTFSVDTVKNNIIKVNSNDAIKKWTVLKQVLRTEFLWTLVTAQRLCPVISVANPNGYTANKITTDPTTGIVSIIKKDDVMLFEHDFVRAYQLVYAMFGDCLHHLISKEIKAGDPVGIFRELDKYLFGHQAKDIIKHSNALRDYSPNFNLTFRENLDKMQQLILSLEGAQERALTNSELNHLLSSKFSSDPRAGHEAIITATAVSTSDFHVRVRQIVDFIDSVVVSKKHVKVAAMNAKTVSPELCRQFIKGSCTRGSTCKYSHSTPTTAKTHTPPTEPPKNKKPWVKGKGGAPTVVPSYTVVSKNHRAIVGVPRGVISAFNPLGFDEKQILTVRKLQVNDEYSAMCKAEKEQSADAWAAQDPSLFAGSNEVSGYKISMFKNDLEYPTSPFDSPQAAPVPSPLEGSDQDLIHSRLLECEEMLKAYDDLQPGVYRWEINYRESLVWIYQKRAVWGSVDAAKCPNHPLVMLFGWSTYDTFNRILPKCTRLRSDIRDASDDMMKLIYEVGESFLGADVSMVGDHVHIPNQSARFLYETFHPFEQQRHETQSTYRSQGIQLEQYFHAFDTIWAHHKINNQTKHLVTIVLLFDFMAFMSHYLTRECGKCPKESKMDQIKDQIMMNINMIQDHRSTFDDIAQTMCGIVLSCNTYRDVYDQMWYKDENAPDEAETSSSSTASFFQDPRITATSPTSPRYDRETVNENNYVRPIYGSDETAKEEEEATTRGSASPLKSTAGATPPTRKRKERSMENFEDIPDVSLMSPPVKQYDVIDLRSPSASKPVSERRKMKYKKEDSFQYFALPSPERPTPLAPPTKIPTSEFKGDRSHMKTFRVGTMARLNNEQPSFMWDTGANRSGTSSKAILKNISTCDPISISGAFGPAITPSLKGELGPMKLDTVVIDGMGPQTIISVSQVCQLGHVAIFTSKDFRVYTLPSVLRAMKVMAHDGKEVVRGTVHNGLYIQDST